MAALTTYNLNIDYAKEAGKVSIIAICEMDLHTNEFPSLQTLARNFFRDMLRNPAMALKWMST
jgi:hypothetical protein